MLFYRCASISGRAKRRSRCAWARRPCYVASGRVIMQRLVAFFVSLALLAASVEAQSLEVVNNQPFDIRMPWLVRGIKAPANAPAQRVGDDAVVLINVPAHGTA